MKMKWRISVLALLIFVALASYGIYAKELKLEIKNGRVDFYEDFTTDKFLSQATITNQDKLYISPGLIGVHGYAGYSVVVDLVYHVKVEKPLVDLLLICDGSANWSHLAGEFTLSISKDGKNWLATKTSRDLRTYSNGTTMPGEELVIENAEEYLGEVTEFWVKLSLASRSGVEMKDKMPAHIKSFSIEGRVKN